MPWAAVTPPRLKSGDAVVLARRRRRRDPGPGHRRAAWPVESSTAAPSTTLADTIGVLAAVFNNPPPGASTDARSSRRPTSSGRCGTGTVHRHRRPACTSAAPRSPCRPERPGRGPASSRAADGAATGRLRAALGGGESARALLPGDHAKHVGVGPRPASTRPQLAGHGGEAWPRATARAPGGWGQPPGDQLGRRRRRPRCRRRPAGRSRSRPRLGGVEPAPGEPRGRGSSAGRPPAPGGAPRPR